jgi:hypothetical protein
MIELLLIAAAIYIGIKSGGEYAVLGAMFAVIILTVAILFWSAFKREVSRTDHRTPIVSLRNERAISGSFLLGSGYIEGTEYYMTYAHERGGLRRIQLPARSTYVYQDENEAPYMAWQTIHYKAGLWLTIWPRITDSQETMRDLHVPTNTIVTEFKLN